MAEIVIDPEVPAAARRELEQTPVSALPGFGDPPPRLGSEAGGKLAEPPGKRLAAGGCLAVAVLLIGDGLATSGAFSGDLLFLGMLICLACIVVGSLSLLQKAAKSPLKSPAAAYHRRYVVPELDLDAEGMTRWRRASQAARSIRASQAVRQGLVDTVAVAAVLPYQLWEIAERLALLSAPERRQSSFLQGLDAGDPGLQAVLAPQRRVRELTVADIERRVGRLEEFAALTASADRGLRRQRALGELAALNADYEELLIRLDEPGGGLRSVAAEAEAAVRRANEAGRALNVRTPRPDPAGGLGVQGGD
ncbi:MAG TPA: hypothetical protein VGD91_15950 [Trebonia sp.]